MLRVLIVDDEPLFRTAIRQIILWETYQCEIVHESANGQDALHYARDHAVDIVIIDLQMPVMNGLAFLEQLAPWEESNKPLVIMLSAYSNYEHVRKAFLLGASDYIVKENLSEEHVGAVIGKATKLVQEKMQETERVIRELERNTVQLKENYIRAMLLGDSPMEDLDALYRGSYCVPVCIRTDILDHTIEQRNDPQYERFMYRTMMQVLEQYYVASHLVLIQEGEYAVLLMMDASSRGTHERVRITETLLLIRNHVKQYLNASLSIAIAEGSADPHQWKLRYDAARNLTKLRFYYGSGQIFHAEDPSRIIHVKRSVIQAAWPMKDMLYKLELGNGAWEAEFEQSVQRLKQLGNIDVEEHYMLYKTLLWELGALLHMKGYEWSDIVEAERTPVDMIEQFVTMTEVHVWLHQLLCAAGSLVDPVRKITHAHPKIVEQAKQLIARHYEEQLSLSLICEWVGVSESYFSRLFVKETGENFHNYVMNYRIQKAVQMMDSGMKLYEIGEKVGYPNQAHFSKIFKKVTGKSPLHYRAKTE